MAKTITTKYVNLFEYPEAQILQPQSTLTIGDLHGNAIKLLFFLAESGILSLRNQAYDYQKLVEIYYLEIDLIQPCHLDQFESILEAALFNPVATTIKIRLLGDEVADRGQNDYFTLLILEQLHKHFVPIEIIFSNHSAEFVKFYEEDYPLEFVPLIFAQNMEYIKSLGCATYQKGLIYFLKHELVPKDKILFLITNIYKPSLKLLSYNIELAKQNLCNITIYSHAPVGLETIKALADKFNIMYNSNCDILLEQFINILEQINQEFNKLVENNLVTKGLLEEKPYLYAEKPHISSLPVLRTIWNRIEHPVSDAPFFRPHFMSFKDQKCKMHYTHGHDGQGNVKISEQEYVTNLDNCLGMSYNNDYNEQGEYTVEKECPTPKAPIPSIEVPVLIYLIGGNNRPRLTM